MNHEGIVPDTGPSPEQLAAFLDGELDGCTRARVEVWLKNHPSAAEEIEGQRRVMRVWQESVPAEPSAAAWAAAFDRIEARLRPGSHRLRVIRRALWLSAGLAAAVLTPILLTRQFQPNPSIIKPQGIGSSISAETDREPILLASQDDVSVVNIEPYSQDDGRVPSIGEGDVSMIVAAPLAADPLP